MMAIDLDIETGKYAACVPTTKTWAEKHGYDIVIVKEFFDKSIPICSRTIYMQKLLICSQEWSKNYSHIVWKDLDIYLNENAPDLCEDIPEGKIAAVNERLMANKYDWRTFVQLRCGYEATGREYYMKNKIVAPFDDHFQAGLMVFQPQFHRAFLEAVYKKWIDIVVHDETLTHGDQPIISFESISHNIVHWLDERWNMVWPLWKVLMYSCIPDEDRVMMHNALHNMINISYGVHMATGMDVDLLYPQQYMSDTNMIIVDNRELLHTVIPSRDFKIAEIGVFKGDFASYLSRHFNISELHLIDPWAGVVNSGDQDGNNEVFFQGESLHSYVSSMFKTDSKVTIHRDYSYNTMPLFADDYLDMVYIDGDHSYNGCKTDLELAWRKVKNGGWIAGHDFEMNHQKTHHRYDFGVKKAVEEFCKTYNQTLFAKAMDGCVSFVINVKK